MYSKCIRSFLKQWTLLLSLHFSDFQVRNSLAGFGVLICESGKAREPIALRPRLYSPPRADLGAGPLSATCHPEPMQLADADEDTRAAWTGRRRR